MLRRADEPAAVGSAGGIAEIADRIAGHAIGGRPLVRHQDLGQEILNAGDVKHGTRLRARPGPGQGAITSTDGKYVRYRARPCVRAVSRWPRVWLAPAGMMRRASPSSMTSTSSPSCRPKRLRSGAGIVTWPVLLIRIFTPHTQYSVIAEALP